MKQYKVTWGDLSQVVLANTECDAWAEFCRGNELAAKHPVMHKRKIVEVKQKPEKAPAK